MVKYTSIEPVPLIKDDELLSGGALDQGSEHEANHKKQQLFINHRSALKHVLSLCPDSHHFMSHTAGVLADVIEKHEPTDHASLGVAIRHELKRRGVSNVQGGSFWDCVGKAVSAAWDGTVAFVKAHAKDLEKMAVDVAAGVGSALATATGNPELVPLIEGAAQLGKKAIGGALPTTHLVGALRDVQNAPSTQAKAALIHKDYIMTNEGKTISPVLPALHFAHSAMPHVRDGVVGGGMCDGGRGKRQNTFSEAVMGVLQENTILCAQKRDGKSQAEISAQRGLLSKSIDVMNAARTELMARKEKIPDHGIFSAAGPTSTVSYIENMLKPPCT